MITQIAFHSFLGLPLIAYGGMATFFSFVLTALAAVLQKNGKKLIPLAWHKRLAFISLFFGLMHGLFGILSYI